MINIEIILEEAQIFPSYSYVKSKLRSDLNEKRNQFVEAMLA